MAQKLLWRFVATGGAIWGFLPPHGELWRHRWPQKNVANCGAMWRKMALIKFNCGATWRQVAPHFIKNLRHIF